MTVIHKYKIEKVRGPQEVNMPAGAVPVFIGVQTDSRGSHLYVWAIVDPNQTEMVSCPVQVVGTGLDIPTNGVYVGSVIDGPYVWHLFQIIDYVAEPLSHD